MSIFNSTPYRPLVMVISKVLGEVKKINANRDGNICADKLDAIDKGLNVLNGRLLESTEIMSKILSTIRLSVGGCVLFFLIKFIIGVI